MQRKYRLTSSTDFKRVRQDGKAIAHPLLVLIRQPNDLDHARFGVAAGRSVGGAVERNRAKRRLREVLRSLLPRIQTGWDILILARRPITHSAYPDIENAVRTLLQRAHLLAENHVP